MVKASRSVNRWLEPGGSYNYSGSGTAWQISDSSLTYGSNSFNPVLAPPGIEENSMSGNESGFTYTSNTLVSDYTLGSDNHWTLWQNVDNVAGTAGYNDSYSRENGTGPITPRLEILDLSRFLPCQRVAWVGLR